MNSLYILEINPSSVALFANIFSHSVGCLLVLPVISFAVQKLLSLIIFDFIFIILGGGSKQILTAIYVRVFCLCFPLCFIVFGFKFRSLIHFEFIFVYSVRECSNFIYLHVASSFPSATYWRDSLFSIMYSCFLCTRLMDHRCVSLFLGFLSCYIHLYFCFCTSTILFQLL